MLHNVLLRLAFKSGPVGVNVVAKTLNKVDPLITLEPECYK